MIVAIVCNILLLAWYLGVDYRAYLHSDTAVKNTLAQEMLETGRYFPAQWNYVNGDLWVFFTQTLVLPFLLVLPNGFAAHAAAGAVAAALVLHATWLLGTLAGQSRTAKLVALLVVSAGLSHNLAENLYGQAAYGMLYCMGVWLLFCSMRAAQANGRARAIWTAAAATVLLLVFWANPQRAAAYYFAPLLAAACVIALRRRAWPDRHELTLAAALLAGAVLGTLLYFHTCRQVNSAGAPTTLFFASLDMARVNVGHLFEGLFLLLTELPTPGQRVLTSRGIVMAVYLLAAATFLFVLLPWAVARAWRQRSVPIAVPLVFALAGLAVSIFLTVTTTLSVYSSSDGAIRYLVPHLLVLLVLFVGVAIDLRAPITPLGVAAIAVLALFGARSLATYGPVTAADFRRVHTQQADRMIAFFQQHKLEYGYAPFWDAGRLTVLANHRVRLRQIDIKNGLPVPMRHLSSDRWYEPTTWRGRTFLLLNTDEQKTFRPDLMARRAGPPAEVLDFEGWRIVVYDHNIAADLPAWDTRFLTPRHFIADEAIQHLVGKVQAEPCAIVAAAGEPGVLAFGQYLAPVPGRYVATFDIETEGGAPNFGDVDAVSRQGNFSHGRVAITHAGRQKLVLPLSVPRSANDFELRVISNGSGRVILHGVTLQAAQQ